MKTLYLLLLLLILSACTHSKQEPEISYLNDVKGCFLLYNLKSELFEEKIGGENCKERYPALSSFKIPLAVMAFDSGVLKDENVVFKWNGVKSSRPESDRDHTGKTWMRDSIVWYSQRITEKLGKEKFQNYLDKFDYGNKNLSEGIKTAWLTSPTEKGKGLEISAYEQVKFMKKLWKEELPVTERSMKLTQEITFLETTPKGFQFSGKTGSNFFDKDKKIHLGWFISHLKKGDKEYIAVTNFRDIKPFEDGGYGGPRAKEITKKILADKGLW